MKKFIITIVLVVLMACSGIQAFAVESPTATPVESITISFQNGTNAKAYVSVHKTGDVYTLECVPNTQFKSWSFYKLDGTNAILGTDYEYLVGNETAISAQVKVLNGIIICGNYGDTITKPIPVTEKPTNPETIVETNKEDTSPKTGDSFPYIIINILLASALIVVFCIRKIVECRK